LAKVYPVDTKKVFLVGHSMGAAQAVATAGRHPGRFAGVAALGGGGGFKATEEIKTVPFFVGCGERDFALNGSRNLHKALVKGGVKKAVFQAYPDVEHLAIVQLALPDVFRFFEEAGGP
jgi:predicted esterase